MNFSFLSFDKMLEIKIISDLISFKLKLIANFDQVLIDLFFLFCKSFANCSVNLCKFFVYVFEFLQLF